MSTVQVSNVSNKTSDASYQAVGTSRGSSPSRSSIPPLGPSVPLSRPSAPVRALRPSQSRSRSPAPVDLASSDQFPALGGAAAAGTLPPLVLAQPTAAAEPAVDPRVAALAKMRADAAALESALQADHGKPSKQLAASSLVSDSHLEHSYGMILFNKC